MPQNEPITILVINEIGEEIKLVTLSFRQFFPGCRVDAVYSLDEALEWASRAIWHLILVDESLLGQRSTSILPELRGLAPSAIIVLQSDRRDPATAMNALQAGADFLLYKKSPAFLTELVLYTRDSMEKRDLRITLERTQERHRRLVDTIGDVLYELDADGRFVYLSPSVTPLLGYTPDELAGVPYSKVVPPDQWDYVRYRFNDRRTGPRAARHVEVELVPKMPTGERTAARVRAELSAKGLYDPQRRFMGTLGLLRDISGRRVQEQTIQHLQGQLQETDRLVTMARRVTTLAKDLQAPLAAVLSQSQQLFSAVQEVRLDQQVQTLLSHATEALRQGEALAHSAWEAEATSGGTINDVLDAVLSTMHPPLLHTDKVARRYAVQLPPFTGDLDSASQLFRTLLSHAQRYIHTVGSHHQLRISTAAIAPSGFRLHVEPVLLSAVEPIEVEIRFDEMEIVAADPVAPPEDTVDLFQAYALVNYLGGRLDFHAPVGGLLSITVWLPVDRTRTEGPPSHPPALLASPPLEHTSGVQSPPKTGKTGTAHLITPISALPDRRQATRASVHLAAQITAGNTMREGTVTNLSLGGASLLVEGVLPLVEDSPVYVLLKTPGAMLELQGLAQSRGTFSVPGSSTPPSTVLAFLFTSHTAIEQGVLASLIDEARERTLSLTLEALLSLPNDLMDIPARRVEADTRTRDHRETLRVRVALAARIETPSLDVAAQRPLALVVNVSRGGACLQMRQAPGETNALLSLHFSTTGSLGPPRTHEPEAPEAILTAQIIWTAPDHTAPSDLRPGPTEAGQRVGIRFLQLTPFAEREINRVVAQHIGSSMDLEGIAGRSSIVSARRECRNARQQVIAVTDDHARHQISPTTPIVIMVPGFGKMQSDYLPLSYFLAANRMRVLRYDHTNHVGHSDGDVLQTTLRGMQADFQTVLDFARTTWPTAPLAVLSEDLGGRIALKGMAMSRTAGILLLANPVLNVQATLENTYSRDVLTEHREGLRRGVANLWGLNINVDQFVADALAGDYADLATSAADLARLTVSPLVFKTRTAPGYLSASLEPSLHALGSSPVVIPLQTELSLQWNTPDERHIGTFQTLFKHISNALNMESTLSEMREAPLPDIARQQDLEQERLRIGHHVSQATRDALWIAHLAQLSQFSNVHEYWTLREHLYRQLLPLEPEMTIVEVGCGQGDLARVILTNQVYRLAYQTDQPALPLRYIGLEHSQDTLTMAEQTLSGFLRELTDTISLPYSLGHLLGSQWLKFDWASASPFPSSQPFARIVFHLSLAFCPSPLTSLRQAVEALDERGAMVITCFQPNSDFSALFRRHLRASGQDEFASPGQVVLHYLGRVREALRHGVLHSYEREELAHLLVDAGADLIHIAPFLDGQLLIALARKGKSAG